MTADVSPFFFQVVDTLRLSLFGSELAIVIPGAFCSPAGVDATSNAIAEMDVFAPACKFTITFLVGASYVAVVPSTVTVAVWLIVTLLFAAGWRVNSAVYVIPASKFPVVTAVPAFFHEREDTLRSPVWFAGDVPEIVREAAVFDEIA